MLRQGAGGRTCILFDEECLQLLDVIAGHAELEVAGENERRNRRGLVCLRHESLELGLKGRELCLERGG